MLVVEIDGKNILMLGSGGAARAISFTLARNAKLRRTFNFGCQRKYASAVDG